MLQTGKVSTGKTTAGVAQIRAYSYTRASLSKMGRAIILHSLQATWVYRTQKHFGLVCFV